MNWATPLPLTSRCNGHTVHWLDDGQQRLGLVPSKGGGAAAWELHAESASGGQNPAPPFHLWRPWLGDDDLFSMASSPLVPWSNRISGGGFEQDGRFHRLHPNRDGEAFPIHGEGWLQPWNVLSHNRQQLEMQLTSVHFMDSPYHYTAHQSYRLLPDGLEQVLSVTHLGSTPLPYGLGQHPWLLRPPGTRLRAPVSGVWLSERPDQLPRDHRSALGGWDLVAGISAHGTLIDHAFTGWLGTARIEWPEAGWALEVRKLDATPDPCLLVFRPAAGPVFCVEPVSHPIDAVHLPGRPGLRLLRQGESTTLHLNWRFERLPALAISASSLRA